MIEVTAGVIENNNNILIARRKAGDRSLSGKWEFPGGKIEKGETPEECLKRELYEELGINVIVGDYLTTSEYKYGEKNIRLIVYRVWYVDGEFLLNAHDEVKWVKREDLPSYDLAEADKPVLRYI